MDTTMEKLYEALKMVQWGFNHRRCVACGGWNCSPNGETDFKHTKECPVSKALKQYESEKR